MKQHVWMTHSVSALMASAFLFIATPAIAQKQPPRQASSKNSATAGTRSKKKTDSKAQAHQRHWWEAAKDHAVVPKAKPKAQLAKKDDQKPWYTQVAKGKKPAAIETKKVAWSRKQGAARADSR